MALGWWVGLTVLAVGASTWSSPTPKNPIVGGEPTADGEFDFVVAIEAGNGLCTGTLITPRLVLTAGHCLASIRNASQIDVLFGPTLLHSPHIKANVVDFGVHPELCTQCKTDIHDYGYLVIEETYSDPEGLFPPIVSQSEWDATMHAGEHVTVVGYGEDPDAEGPTHRIGVKRKVTTTISQLTPEGLEFFAGGGLRDSCEGDSGGPAFVQLPSGEWRLAGITSRGSLPCGDGGFYGVPYPALTWLAETTEHRLCGDECSDCTCLDLSPPGDEGCQCDASRVGGPPVWSWVLLGVGALARRRRRARLALDGLRGPSTHRASR